MSTPRWSRTTSVLAAGSSAVADAREPREDSRPPALVLHEEELHVGKATEPAGSVRFRKSIESEDGIAYVPRSVEDAEVERVAADAGDSGEIETLEDGSLSIPVLEEELVVSKRVVVRERVIVRRRVSTREEPVHAELRRERLEVEADDGAEVVGE